MRPVTFCSFEKMKSALQFKNDDHGYIEVRRGDTLDPSFNAAITSPHWVSA